MGLITITIDEHKLTVEEGTTLLAAATQNGLKIPNLCYDGRVELYGACGLCVVEAEGVGKLLRACSAKATDGMVVHTDTPRVVRARKVALELLLSDHDGDCKAPCTKACPANTDCQGYIGLIANGEYTEAVERIKEKIPMPSSIGRICPHPCEKQCRRAHVDEPISIAHLKSFASDMDMASDHPYVPSVEPDTGKTVAVVGGGPAGLTAAYFLRRFGHSVTVLDAMPKMGGMLRYGIPEYRLPKRILDREIANIEALGVQMQNRVKIGRDVDLQTLRAKYDAVVLAAGAWNSSKMRVPGEDLPGVLGGIDFLRAVALGEAPDVGETVAVIGGGNTAMDACRTAVRLGARQVYVIYRRTRDEMPAEDLEIRESEEEGVQYKFLTAPIAFTEADGRLAGAVLQEMRLGEPDASGRRRPEPIEGATQTIALDTAIMAIGQYPDLTGFEEAQATKRGTVAADESTFSTSLPGVFAVGDMTNKGASIAIEAIGEAQKAATVIDRFLNGETVGYKKPYSVERELDEAYFEQFPKAPRAEMPTRAPAARKADFGEVTLGFTEETAKKEAMRCLSCGCQDYYDCKLIAYANEFDVKPDSFTGEKHHRNAENPDSLIIRNADKCILCGLCVRICDEVMGKTNLGFVGRGFHTLISPAYGLPLEQSECMFCGQCAAVCPTGALLEKEPVKKRVPVQERRVESVCNLCAALCKTDVRYVGNTVLRCLPYGEKGLLCKGGRFGIFAVNGEAKGASEAELSALREQIAAYGSDVAVVLGPTATLEEAAFALMHFPNVYADMQNTAAGFVGARKLGIPSVTAYRGEKAALLLDCKKNASITAQFTVALSNAPVEGVDAQVFVAPFTANDGTYLKTETTFAVQRAAVASPLPTALAALAALSGAEPQTAAQIAELLKHGALANCTQDTASDREIIRTGGRYFGNTASPLIDGFCGDLC